jgi:endogenous inhibitor of DNA gyrase (YacG/DUF329 family)
MVAMSRQFDKRGNNRDRAVRKNNMLSPVSGWGGDTKTVGCVHCGTRVDYNQLEADRKEPGGTYRRENVQPSCPTCNKQRSDNPSWIGPLSRGQLPRDVHE